MQNIKKTAFYSIIALSMLASYAMEGTPTKEAAKSMFQATTNEMIKEIGAVSPYITLAYNLYLIGKATKPHIYPNATEQEHIDKVTESYELLKTENEFEGCLIKNNNGSERGPSGRPTTCENLARMLIMLGAQNEVNKITAIFNEYKKHS